MRPGRTLTCLFALTAVLAEGRAAKPPPCGARRVTVRPMAASGLADAPTYVGAFGPHLLAIVWHHDGKKPIEGRIYDSRNDRWATVAPGLADLGDAVRNRGVEVSVAAADRRFMATWIDRATRSREVRLLDVPANLWQRVTLAPPADPTRSTYPLVAASHLYVVEHGGGTVHDDGVRVWDLRTGAWRDVPPLGGELYRPATVGEHLVALVPRASAESLPSRWELAVYDPALDRWQRQGLADALYNPYIADAGGGVAIVVGRDALEQTGQSSTRGGFHDLRRMRWTPFPAQGPPSHHDTVIAGGLIVVRGTTATPHRFLAPGMTEWRATDQWPDATASLAWTRGKLVALDNRDGHAPVLAVFDPQTRAWCSRRLPGRAPLAMLQSFTSTVVRGNQLFVWGRREKLLVEVGDPDRRTKNIETRAGPFADQGYIYAW